MCATANQYCFNDGLITYKYTFVTVLGHDLTKQ